MSFTEQQKVDLRRHAGYAAYGNANTQNLGWRYLLRTGQFEFIIQQLTAEEESTILASYLAPCNQLFADIYGVRDNADTSQAAVWYRNKDELPERQRLYYWHCEMLCKFLMGPIYGPALGDGSVTFMV
jgi:hypothetical protein